MNLLIYLTYWIWIDWICSTNDCALSYWYDIMSVNNYDNDSRVNYCSHEAAEQDRPAVGVWRLLHSRGGRKQRSRHAEESLRRGDWDEMHQPTRMQPATQHQAAYHGDYTATSVGWAVVRFSLISPLQVTRTESLRQCWTAAIIRHMITSRSVSKRELYKPSW